MGDLANSSWEFCIKITNINNQRSFSLSPAIQSSWAGYKEVERQGSPIMFFLRPKFCVSYYMKIIVLNRDSEILRFLADWSYFLPNMCKVLSEQLSLSIRSMPQQFRLLVNSLLRYRLALYKTFYLVFLLKKKLMCDDHLFSRH